MEQVLAALGRYGALVLALVGVAALLLLNGAAYVRVMRPRSGTLEWISRYDRPSCTLLGIWSGLTRADALPMAAAACGAAAAWGAASWMELWARYGSDIPDVVLRETILTRMIVPALTALAVYRLLRGLFGSRLSALLATLILMLTMTVQPVLLLPVAVCALLLTRHQTAPADATFGETSLWLILAFMTVAIACYLSATMVVLALAMTVILCMGAADRFVHAGRGRLVRSLLAAWISLLAVWLLTYVPGAVAQGLPFPQLLILRDFYGYAAYRIVRGLLLGLAWGIYDATPLYFDWPLLLCGLAAWAVCLVGGLRRPKGPALLAAAWFVALAILWLVTGLYLLPLGCVFCLCSLWADLAQRQQPWLALVAGGSILLVQLSLYGFYWFT